MQNSTKLWWYGVLHTKRTDKKIQQIWVGGNKLSMTVWIGGRCGNFARCLARLRVMLSTPLVVASRSASFEGVARGIALTILR